ncbi:MAG: 50S ribosomal protein L4 [Thermodesulfobacteriota bacterium]
MPQVDVYDLKKKKTGKVELKSEIFEQPVKESLLHLVVRWQLASKRAGSASTKTKGEVRGGGKKPWKQKGLGRARSGSNRSPLWRGGGVTFGPKPKDWSFSLPKKVRKQAIKSALSHKFNEKEIYIVENFDLSEIKTKQVVSFLKKFDISKCLILIDDKNENLMKSSNNLKEVKVLKNEGINVYDILNFKHLVVTKSSLEKVQEVLAS